MTRMRLVTELLIEEIVEAIEQSSSVYILTAFLMKSGVDLLKKPVKEALNRGVEVKVLTGDYMYVTQPEALQALYELDDRIEIRLWKSNGRSFHPKAYLFQFEEDQGHVIIGSSNLSRSALTRGVEWNVSIPAGESEELHKEALDSYLKLFLSENTVPVNEPTIRMYEENYNEVNAKTGQFSAFDAEDEAELMFGDEKDYEHVVAEPKEPYEVLSPRQAQAKALEELERTVEDGYNKALVVMATGLGKTYLAAFFARRFKRVLFIAHREEILYQAKRTFEHVMPDRTHGIFNGKQKDGEADFVFASIFSVANRKQVEEFGQDAFDLIVIDEFHHAAARSYQHVLDYFSYSFLLGLTATPDRMDGKDVYAICDGNVAYRIDFIQAIEQGWLSSFRYYGIYDEIDYSQVTWLGKRYDEEELLGLQLRKDVFDNIYQAWVKHKQTRTLVFCSSIKQADFLAKSFTDKGVACLSLTSKTSARDRKEAVQKLESGELEVILTVDLFNEGVDIPLVDTLLFARPTESLSIFTQQVGRGLRLAPTKKSCVIIDLIGNYRNADVKLSVFRNQDSEGKREAGVAIPAVPDVCSIDLETKVIDLLNELQRKRKPRREQMIHSYYEVRAELGRDPSYLELHLHGEFDGTQYKAEFGSYFAFLKEAGVYTDEEEQVYSSYRQWFLEVERTTMTKSYKMVVLSYMLSRGVEQWFKPVTPVEVASYFHQYYMSETYRKKIDFSAKNTKAMWEYDEGKVARLVAQMPMTKWANSSKGLVTFDGETFELTFEVDGSSSGKVNEWTREVCEYRLHRYFERKAGR
ncbi:DEAD/DEAH box helicase family protein [Halalkalibacter alkaliphilus]|uniref:DEAD/DEAH box helicase family protein n=1 Tax=Halalkalibacter alkaliphilus TaxID=2917993 RepID=A0A9X2I694_9BACI|nr:DEAD/DEAH box helicase family protein [Halalkalibacter alkaliphilus]MCL7748777.1 DEAD/DEAH box helicase family protein [Halalkalibacter alkaliphilus]